MTGTVRILHVDDEPSLAELASTFLEREDDRFSVDTATSVREGLTTLSETDVDCVVSDYDMPEINGIEFLETVREEYPDLPFILFTGKGSEEVASDAISAGVTDYLQKQTSSSQYTVLANRIGNAVEQYRTRRDVERAERKLSRIADKSDDVLFMFDGDWNDLLFVNEAYEDIWGTSVDDLQDDPDSFLERIHPDDREAVIRSMDRISSGEEDALEYRVVRPDGEQRWVRAESKPVFDDDGTVSHVVGFVRDVTERTLRERELEDVRERFRLLVEHGSDMISVLDDAGIIQYQSPAIERILGYEAAGLVGESAFEYVHPDDRDRIWESFVQTIEQDEPATERVEYRFRRADGSWIWLETIGSNQTDTAIDGYVLTTRDITERRERERELERTNALLSTLFETLPVGVLAEDESRTLLAVNDRAVDLFDLSGTPEALVGTDCTHVAETIASQFADPEAFVERVDELVATRERTDVEELALRDGRTVARSHRSVEFPDGDGHLWVYRDVTDRTERENRLETLNEMTQDLMTADSIERVAEIGVEAARDILDLDANAIHLYDADRAALVPVAATQSVYDLVGEPPTFTEDDSIAWRVYEAGDPVALDDIDDDPDIYNLDTPFRSELLVPIGDHGILLAGSPTPEAFDDHDLVLADILAGNVETALEQVERTEQLRTRERELTRQNERLDEFASVVSHDLRNPLTVAEGRIELLAEEYDSPHLEEVEWAVERMTDLIDELLGLAREGDRVGELEAVDIGTLSRSCWQTVATERATIRCELDRPIEADRIQLRQILENLLRNAIEHGGEDVTVTIGAVDDGTGFYVEDDGPGIPHEDRDRVFDVGYSTSAAGTGLGLSIVQRVADAHDWELSVSDGRDGGTRFEITNVGFADE